MPNWMRCQSKCIGHLIQKTVGRNWIKRTNDIGRDHLLYRFFIRFILNLMNNFKQKRSFFFYSKRYRTFKDGDEVVTANQKGNSI